MSARHHKYEKLKEEHKKLIKITYRILESLLHAPKDDWYDYEVDACQQAVDEFKKLKIKYEDD